MHPDQAWAKLLSSDLAGPGITTGVYVQGRACMRHEDGRTDYAAWVRRPDGRMRVASFTIDPSGEVAPVPAPWVELEDRDPGTDCGGARKRRCRNDIAQRGIETLWAAARTGTLVNVAVGNGATTLPARYVDYACRFERVCRVDDTLRRRIRYWITDDRRKTYILTLGMDTAPDGSDKSWTHYRLVLTGELPRSAPLTSALPRSMLPRSMPPPSDSFPGMIAASAGFRPYGSNWQCRAPVCAIDRALTIARRGGTSMHLTLPLPDWGNQVAGAINTQLGGNCFKRTTPFAGMPRKICVHVVLRGPGKKSLEVGKAENFPWPIPGWKSSQICAISVNPVSGSVIAEVRLYTSDWQRAAVADVPYAPSAGMKDPGYVISNVLDKFAVVALDGGTHVGWGVGNVQIA